MKFVNKLFLLVGAMAILSSASAQTIYSCKDSRGKVIFTDSARKCPSVQGDSVNDDVVEVDISPMNMHSKYGKTISEEYRNYLYRQYEPIAGYGINLIAEKKLSDESPELLHQAAEKLQTAVSSALQRLSGHAQHQLQDVKFYLFSGDEVRTGGRRGGQWYFRKGTAGYKPFWNSIVIRSAKFYIDETDEWAAEAALHELSHAYYYKNYRRLARAARKSFANAEKNKLYYNTKTKRGRVIKKAYAMTNEREYFAELSKVFHIGNYYYPYNREDLKEYDAEGYKLISSAFYYKI